MSGHCEHCERHISRNLKRHVRNCETKLLAEEGL